MKWRNLVQIAPIWLLLLVMASQIYSMGRQFMVSLSPVVISTFKVDFNKCAVEFARIGDILSSGLREYGSVGNAQDVIVSKLAGDELRIVMQLKDPGEAAFAEETRLVKTLVRCSGTPFCEANPSVGEQLGRGCEISEAEFQPQGWEMSKATGNRVDALAIIALFIQAAALYYLMRKSRTPAGAMAA